MCEWNLIVFYTSTYCLWPNGTKWSCLICCCDQDVLHRHPLYLIVRMLCYDDGLGAGKNLLALKTTDAQQEGCSIWVYQCSSSVRINSTVSDAMCHYVKTLLFSLFQEQAQSICKVLSASFDCALSLDKSWWSEKRRRSEETDETTANESNRSR